MTIKTISKEEEIYTTMIKDAMAKIDELELLLIHHHPAEKINYGHIGDICHVTELLDEMMSFLNGNGGE